jgi:tetratricopeptide (TPR) repeat protein
MKTTTVPVNAFQIPKWDFVERTENRKNNIPMLPFESRLVPGFLHKRSIHSFMKLLVLFTLFVGFSAQSKAEKLLGEGAMAHDSCVYYLAKGKELYQSRLIQQAERSFIKSLEFEPTNEEARVALAKFYLDNRKYPQSREQFAKLLEKDINHKLALENLLDIAFMLRKWDDVLMYGNKLIQNNAAKDVEYKIAKAHYHQENYGEAIRMMEAAVTKDPKNAEAFYVLGLCKVEVSAYNDAIRYYTKSIDLDTSKAQRIYELGLLYFSINDGPHATKFMELAGAKGIKKDNDFYENLGMAYLEFNLEKGVEVLNTLLLRKPDTEIMFQIAQAYYKAAKFDKAVENWNRVTAADPQNYRAMYMVGMSYQKMGKVGEGRAICDKAISLDPALANLKQQKFNVQN